MRLTIQDLLGTGYVAAHNFEALTGNAISGVSTDSRTVADGEVFFALRGERFDGSKFVKQALGNGAQCAVINDGISLARLRSQPILVVKDTVRTLGMLARNYRLKIDIPFIAVAGSNGKTTTKEMIASVLSTTYNVLHTPGNLNNHIGVPQTIFRLRKEHEVAVVEIGTNHFGELEYLCSILEPTHGLLTNIGREHLEFFRNLNGVARAEGELFLRLGASGMAFVNADDRYVVSQAGKLRKKRTYGFSRAGLHVRGRYIGTDRRGCVRFSVEPRGGKAFEVKLSIPGRHAMANALAAAAVGLSFKVSPRNIAGALRGFSPPGKRMEVLNAGGVTIINDTYNANPDSVHAALEALQSLKCTGKKVLILGDMLELGKKSKEEHIRIASEITALGFDHLFTYGPMARAIHGKAKAATKFHYERKKKLAERVMKTLLPGDVVLVKGSRGMKMEEVVDYLKDRLRPGPN